MDKEKLKKIKVLYYPYKFAKKTLSYLKDINAIFTISKVEKSIKKKTCDKIKVVILMQYIPSWGKVKQLFEFLRSKDLFDVSILCVPMEKNHQDFNCSKYEVNETYEWFVNEGYDCCIDALVGEGIWYDLKKSAPDFVIYTRHYNLYLPDQYKSFNVYKYALVCVIGYGINLTTMALHTINKDFFRYVKYYFVDNKDTYDLIKKQYSLSIACKTTQFPMCGSPILEHMLIRSKRYNGDIKGRNGSHVLWTPRWSTDPEIGGSNYFKYADFLIDSAIKPDTKLYLNLRPHPLMFTNFLKTGELTEKDISILFDKSKQSEYLHIDEEEEYFDSIQNSDLLVTDYTSMIIEYFITGKPIIYCKSDLNVEFLDVMKNIINVCYTVENIDELKDVLSMLLKGNDPLKEKRESLVSLYIDLYANDSSERISKVLSSIRS